jgi:hypothetical protein
MLVSSLASRLLQHAQFLKVYGGVVARGWLAVSERVNDPETPWVMSLESKRVWPGGDPMWLSMSFEVAVGCRTSRRATWRTGRRSGVVRAR